MTLILNFSNNLHKTRCMGVFGVVDCTFDVRIANFKIAHTRWRLFYSNFEVFEELTQNLLYGYFFGRWLRFWSQNWKIQNLVSELQNLKWRIQNGGYISANSQFFSNCAETWYFGGFRGRWSRFWHQNCKIKNGRLKMAVMWVEIENVLAIATKLGISSLCFFFIFFIFCLFFKPPFWIFQF